MQPRAPPQVPSQPAKESVGHSKSASDPTTPKLSPKLPRWSAGGDFSMDEDMARILGTDEGSSSILRRVSNAVRHGRNNSTESSSNHHMPRIGHSRSVSETTRMTGSPRWPKTPITEESYGGHGHEISSPISLSGAANDDPAFLKRQLRNSEQKLAEMERHFGTKTDLQDLNKKVMEKRKTVVVLDTQNEIMLRQLEILAGYVEHAKETGQPIDPRELEESAIKEFVQKLDKVKQSMSASIEQLLAERDDLMEEKNQAIADRDRALLEFETLSGKNAQLAEMNNDLTHQIQEKFKSQIGSELKSPNGLGIYSHHSKGASNASVNLDSSSLQTAHTLVATDDDPLLEGPTVVNIRKGQARKFNWKKGGSKVASGITKGINRAAVAFQGPDQPQPHRYPGLAGENIGLPYNMTVSQVDSPVTQGPNGQNRVPSETAGKGFGFFGGNKTKPPRTMNAINMAGSIPTIAEAPTTLFGSDLVERADYERRQIPSVVTRCIEEVELRGMDVEGIYRKTGGNSQVKMVQEGFDKSEDFDISDTSIDITAVTSVLKQYFRKLPVPLLTFDVYERILESNAIQPDAERCDHLRQTFNMLPPKHRDCLEFLMFHLARVASRERENLMSPKNLAVVFAPTIMRDQSIEKEMTDMHSKNIAVQYIIEHSDTIFSDA
ncbi:rho-type GTPase-activating protein [Coniochaeta ligniaria NRRL 30616]|uniref:Rho-type GTPase-activating protein n=1 Tax=Coniochaeta ligniaria NRRL 30616 TaxID=1408157 RepID=A0A1J7JGN0_9PEZI|nr:rho-type GTPase-activating protein [Coniochaeta ligniaria NRRL 30616]